MGLERNKKNLITENWNLCVNGEQLTKWQRDRKGQEIDLSRAIDQEKNNPKDKEENNGEDEDKDKNINEVEDTAKKDMTTKQVNISPQIYIISFFKLVLQDKPWIIN